LGLEYPMACVKEILHCVLRALRVILMTHHQTICNLVITLIELGKLFGDKGPLFPDLFMQLKD